MTILAIIRSRIPILDIIRSQESTTSSKINRDTELLRNRIGRLDKIPRRDNQPLDMISQPEVILMIMVSDQGTHQAVVLIVVHQDHRVLAQVLQDHLVVLDDKNLI